MLIASARVVAWSAAVRASVETAVVQANGVNRCDVLEIPELTLRVLVCNLVAGESAVALAIIVAAMITRAIRVIVVRNGAIAMII